MTSRNATLILILLLFINGACAMNNDAQVPIFRAEATVQNNSKDEFLDSFKVFAEDNALTFTFSYVRPGQIHYLIEMENKNIKIVVNNPFKPEDLRVNFYNAGDEEVSNSFIDSLNDQIKDIFNKLPDSNYKER